MALENRTVQKTDRFKPFENWNSPVFGWLLCSYESRFQTSCIWIPTVRVKLLHTVLMRYVRLFGSESTYQFYGIAKGSGGVDKHDVGAGQSCEALVEVVTV